VTSQILFKEWQLDEGEEEFTIMRVVIEGEGRKVVYDVFDRRDKKTGLSSMARTTGFTCAAVARLFLEGKVSTSGVHAPEQIGMAGRYEAVAERLKQHGIRIGRVSK
jgi:saccharopine dehydrogenase-like NADP-dependent oxidoreductase